MQRLNNIKRIMTYLAPCNAITVSDCFILLQKGNFIILHTSKTTSCISCTENFNRTNHSVHFVELGSLTIMSTAKKNKYVRPHTSVCGKYIHCNLISRTESMLPLCLTYGHGFSEVVDTEVVKSNYCLQNWIGKENLNQIQKRSD